MEAALKICAYGWNFYIISHWNKFDFFLVVMSCVDICISQLTDVGSYFQVLRTQKLLRITRVSRMIKLVKSMKSVKSLFATLMVSLPAFWNVGALLLLCMFVYAYLGVQLFGIVQLGQHLNEHANFQRFWQALLTLFRCEVQTSCVHLLNTG
jgi:Ion transport protein